MAQYRSPRSSGRSSGGSRLSIKHNLEKTPLQSGELQPRVSLAQRIRMGDFSPGLVGIGVVLAVLILLAIGVMVELGSGSIMKFWTDAIHSH